LQCASACTDSNILDEFGTEYQRNAVFLRSFLLHASPLNLFFCSSARLRNKTQRTWVSLDLHACMPCPDSQPIYWFCPQRCVLDVNNCGLKLGFVLLYLPCIFSAVRLFDILNVFVWRFINLYEVQTWWWCKANKCHCWFQSKQIKLLLIVVFTILVSQISVKSMCSLWYMQKMSSCFFEKKNRHFYQLFLNVT
jgi:hypothetical protein